MDYKELNVWKHSRNLAKSVYLLTKHFPKKEIYDLTNQIRKSTFLVPSNIAEGVGRKSNTEVMYFPYIAKSSLNEIKTKLYLPFHIAYIEEIQLEEILKKLISCKKIIKRIY